ncbi:hypothetical protein [Actinoplanes sp. TFC3]|uniref:hypothetical protein n=1 Tax=Actinoplanes sp. TFC3 TaxID=1710355 RepID=UPI00082E0BAA|nr:hypothetical protein [Actinoplanes sp. TFC3]
MPDPIMLAVATAVAVRTAEAAVAQSPAAWASLVRLVRRRFSGNPHALEALAEARAQPENAESVRALANSLDYFAARDQAFDTELRALWAQVDTNNAQSSVMNYNAGGVTGLLLQGRDITLNGPLHLGGTSEAP